VVRFAAQALRSGPTRGWGLRPLRWANGPRSDSGRRKRERHPPVTRIWGRSAARAGHHPLTVPHALTLDRPQ
jgi:hypothetical protein